MQIRFPSGNRLLRRVVLLGFLGCLVAQGTLYSQTAASESLIAPSAVFAWSTYQSDALCLNTSDFMLTEQLEMGLPDDGDAFEVEIFRVDIQQRIFGIDQVKIGPKVASKVASNARPNISPPLLV